MNDPITFAVVKAGLDTIVDDMAYAVMRTARSPTPTWCGRSGR